MAYGTIKADGLVNSTGNTVDLTQVKSTDATSGERGLMSAADKDKLDLIEAGAQANVITSVNGETGDVTVQGFSGDYDDLTNKPALGTAAATAAADYATAAQGTKADTATQPGDLGTAAATDATAYATAAQGAKADTATQPGDLGTAATTAATDYATAAQGVKADSATQPGDLGTAAATDATAYATAAQGAKADTATQPSDLAVVQADIDQNEIDSDAAIATEKGRIDAILSAADADKDSFAEIVTLINSVDTTNDTAFAGYVTSNDAAVAAVQADVDQNESDSDAAELALSNRLDTLETDPTTATAVAAVQADVDQNEANLATVATSGSYNDLSNKPAPFDPNTLATVATTGEYSDLSSTPTLGTAAATDSTAYATAAQGTKADTATQPGDLGTAAATDATAYATAAQGTKADSAVQAADLAAATIVSVGTTTTGSSNYMSPDIDGMPSDSGKFDASFFTFVRPENQFTMTADPTNSGTPNAELVSFFALAGSGDSFYMKDRWNGIYSTHKEYVLNSAITDNGDGTYSFTTSTSFSIPAGGPSSGSDDLDGNDFMEPFNVKYDNLKTQSTFVSSANPAFDTSVDNVTINGVTYATSDWTVSGTGATHSAGSTAIAGLASGQLISTLAKVATTGRYSDLANDTVNAYTAASSGGPGYMSPDINGSVALNGKFAASFFTFVRPENQFTMTADILGDGTSNPELVAFFAMAGSGDSFYMKDKWNGTMSTHKQYVLNSAITDNGDGTYSFTTSTSFNIPAGGPSSGSDDLDGNDFMEPFNVEYDNSSSVAEITSSADPAFDTNIAGVVIGGRYFPTSEWTVTGSTAVHTGAPVGPVEVFSVGDVITQAAGTATGEVGVDKMVVNGGSLGNTVTAASQAVSEYVEWENDWDGRVYEDRSATHVLFTKYAESNIPTSSEYYQACTILKNLSPGDKFKVFFRAGEEREYTFVSADDNYTEHWHGASLRIETLTHPTEYSYSRGYNSGGSNKIYTPNSYTAKVITGENDPIWDTSKEIVSIGGVDYNTTDFNVDGSEATLKDGITDHGIAAGDSIVQQSAEVVLKGQHGNVTLSNSGDGALKCDSRFSVAGALNLGTSKPDAWYSDGTAGDIAWDASYIYVCVATNTWKRTAIASW